MRNGQRGVAAKGVGERRQGCCTRMTNDGWQPFILGNGLAQGQEVAAAVGGGQDGRHRLARRPTFALQNSVCRRTLLEAGRGTNLGMSLSPMTWTGRQATTVFSNREAGPPDLAA